MKLHQDFEVLRTPNGLFDVEPCEMDLNVGKLAKYVDPDTKCLGSVSLEVFRIVGIQKNFRGVVCYRGCYLSDLQGVGFCVSSDHKIELLN